MPRLDLKTLFKDPNNPRPEELAAFRREIDSSTRLVNDYMRKVEVAKPSLSRLEHCAIADAFFDGRDVLTEPGGLDAFLAKVNEEDQRYLKRRLTIEEAEAENKAEAERFGIETVPVGCLNTQWKSLLAQMQPGDELWEFSTPTMFWENLAGQKGVALVRNGEVISQLVTLMN
jgi:hypothetical protein